MLGFVVDKKLFLKTIHFPPKGFKTVTISINQNTEK